MTLVEMIGVAATVGAPAAAGLIWAVRLEGRLNTHEQVCGERYKNLAERHEDTTDKLDAIGAKLDRLVER